MSNLIYISFTSSLQALGVAEISTGFTHGCALFLTGSAVCWGSNSSQELGYAAIGSNMGDSANEMLNIVPLNFKASYTTSLLVQIACGKLTTCALFSNGRILCFGEGSDGATGRDSSADVGVGTPLSTLTYIAFSDSIPATMLSLARHSCALFINGRIRCFGDNLAQQLGDTTTISHGRSSTSSITAAVFVTFAPTINTLEITLISAGMFHTCVLFNNGKTICFGAALTSSGQLGTVYLNVQSLATCGSSTCLPVSSAGFIGFSNDHIKITSISAGSAHTCGITKYLTFKLC